jgi:protocatechuate 3,4-dioxygenase beta subunit
MADIYNREDEAAQPPSLFPAYASTVRRAPGEALIRIPQTITETTGPADCWGDLMGGALADMTKQHTGEPVGQRIIVTGRVLDENAKPVPNTVIEIWQANAAGRYIHSRDNWPAPLDPNFTGVGRVASDAQGRYRFITIRPGA